MNTITIDRALVEQALETLEAICVSRESGRVGAKQSPLRAALAQQAG
jgi:hypothetical protein